MKIFSKKKKNKPKVTYRSERIGAHPEREWVVILAVFICLNIATIGFHAFLFYQISQGGFFSAPESVPTELNSVDRERLIDTLYVFEEREQKLIESVVSPADVPAVRGGV